VHPSGPAEASIWIDEADLIELGWSLLEAVAASVLSGASLLDALEAELRRWRDLVSRLASTTVEAAIGVLGELAMMKSALVQGHDPSCWVGRDGGAIDFRLGRLECEVKTTLASRHEHMVNGSQQLQPSPRFQLVIVSLLIAPAEEGTGSSVQTLVSDLVGAGLQRAELEEALAQHRHVHLADAPARTFYILRAEPMVVDAKAVPAVTMEVLEKALGDQAARIRDITYRIDLQGLPTVDDATLATVTGGVTL
jgi:hypothetical protein